MEPLEIPEYTSEQINTLLDKSGKSLRTLTKVEKLVLTRLLRKFIRNCPNIASFPKQFEESYAYEELLNSENARVDLLFRILSNILLAIRLKRFKPDTLGQLHDAARNAIELIPVSYRRSEKQYESWQASLRNLGEIAARFGTYSADITDLVPDFSEFVPDSFEYLDIKLRYYNKEIREFGQVL